ncbi:MAG: DUF3368 domain-containing protein [Syntrophobacteraceae bacterium]
MKHIVCDASPLIILGKAGLLGVLPDQFQRIFCPQAVVGEIVAGPAEGVARRMLLRLTWLEFVTLDPPLSPLAVWQLGRGEAEVIEYARLNPGTVALLDDHATRRAAAAARVPLLGTLSLIARWVALDSSRSFDDAMSKLQQSGLYLMERQSRSQESLEHPIA